MSELKKIAKLCRISIPDSESLVYEDYFKSITAYIEQIAQLEIDDDILPLVNPFEGTMSLREDEPKKWDKYKEAIKESPQSEGSLFEVPPVL